MRSLNPIPYGCDIVLVSALGGESMNLLAAPVRIIDRSLCRVSLARGDDALTVQENGRVFFAARSSGPSQEFQ